MQEKRLYVVYFDINTCTRREDVQKMQHAKELKQQVAKIAKENREKELASQQLVAPSQVPVVQIFDTAVVESAAELIKDKELLAREKRIHGMIEELELEKKNILQFKEDLQKQEEELKQQEKVLRTTEENVKEKLLHLHKLEDALHDKQSRIAAEQAPSIEASRIAEYEKQIETLNLRVKQLESQHKVDTDLIASMKSYHGRQLQIKRK